MSEILLLLLSTALVNNVVLIKFLGLCPVMGVSKRVDSALGMGLATTFVLVLASAASWMLDNWLLQPLGLGYLRILTSAAVRCEALLHAAGQVPSPACPHCGQPEETLEHM